MKLANLKKSDFALNDYDKQAADFLTKTGSTIELVYIGAMINNDWGSGKERHDRYTVLIKNLRGTMEITFWDSIVQTYKRSQIYQGYYSDFRIMSAGQYLTRWHEKLRYPVLTCLVTYDPSSFENFCSEFGYDTDSRKAHKTWEVCHKQWADLQRIFTIEEIELLREII